VLQEKQDGSSPEKSNTSDVLSLTCHVSALSSSGCHTEKMDAKECLPED